MNSKRFFQWCRVAVSGIKYRPDRDAVHKELYQHLEDRYESLADRGINAQYAEEQTLRAMGSAEEIAPQLAAIHRPFWPFMLIISRCVLVLLAALIVLQLPGYLAALDIQTVCFDTYDPYGDTEWQSEYAQWERILYLEPDRSVTADSYTVTVQKAAWWKACGSSEEDAFHIRLQVRNLCPWAEPTQIGHMFRAEDSLGNRYYSRNEAGYNYDAYLGGGVQRTGLFTYTFEMQLVNFASHEAQWIDLRYDRDGRNLVLRIDLSGGEQQ